MDNASIAAVFEELAELLEFKGENPFRIRAYTQGAKAIRDLDESVAEIVADPGRKLVDLDGIGKTLAEKTATLLQTGKLEQLEELRDDVPEVLMQMSRIPGLGAKKAVKLHDELGIESLSDLRTACDEGKVAKLKGFGGKTQDSILQGLAIAEQAAERVYWAKGDELARSIGDHMEACEAIVKMQWAGSYRRGRETVGDLDLLVVASNRVSAMDHLEAYPERTQTIGRGETKLSIRVGKAFQVDMRLVEAHQFGAALQYFTGSQAHNIRTRRIAKEKGLKINEYGVFRIADEAQVAGASEEDVYAAIGLPWIPPELREDRLEFDGANKGSLPKLLETKDIRGDLHMHTTATDGQNTIREMADEAIRRGLKYIAITDHSQRVSMAMGLDGKRLRDQWKEVDTVRPEYDGRLVILKGIECDILEAGGMDLPDDVLAEADWAIASIHYGQRQPRDQITDRILGALENDHVDCLAHPTGRLINRRPPYDADMDAILKTAAANKKFVELNANPARLDLNDLHLIAAKKMGVPIVISTDAHNTDGFGVLQYGIKQARRAGLEKGDVANAKTAKQFLKLLHR
ncbi:MAG: DNA polymerase/3'-5' exonuclease PolX [Planctomycetota bacterium]